MPGYKGRRFKKQIFERSNYRVQKLGGPPFDAEFVDLGADVAPDFQTGLTAGEYSQF